MTLYKNFRWGLTGELQQMLVEDGQVIGRGPGLSTSRETVATVDLEGKYLLPRFVDAHCHVLPTGLDLLALHLGPAQSHDDVLDLVRQRHQDQPEGWLLGVHYNHNQYGGHHLSREALDAISADRPILLRHSNGHASVANSAALRAAGVTEETPDPEGGEYVRDASGRMTGVLLEHAHERLRSSIPLPSVEEMTQAILRAGQSMRDFGIGCASDMMTGFFDLERELQAYQAAADQGCPVKIRHYVQWSSVFGPRGIGPSNLPKVAGIKIFADGAIMSATAAIYGAYSGETANGPRISRRGHEPTSPDGRETSGQLIYRPDRLKEMVRVAHEAGFSVSVHAIGDYAVDLVMDAFAATDEPSRHRLEHAMLLDEHQIERLSLLDCEVTFQPEFLLRFGPSYQRQLGPERTARLKPARSVLDAGIKLSFNSDRPIVGGNPWDGILTAETRPEGFDPAENVTRAEAIRLYTSAGSRANGDADRFGTLNPGTDAGFQTYAMDPLTHPAPRPDVQV